MLYVTLFSKLIFVCFNTLWSIFWCCTMTYYIIVYENKNTILLFFRLFAYKTMHSSYLLWNKDKWRWEPSSRSYWKNINLNIEKKAWLLNRKVLAGQSTSLQTKCTSEHLTTEIFRKIKRQQMVNKYFQDIGYYEFTHFAL
jgi:hypothetical protein